MERVGLIVHTYTPTHLKAPPPPISTYPSGNGPSVNDDFPISSEIPEDS